MAKDFFYRSELLLSDIEFSIFSQLDCFLLRFLCVTLYNFF